MSEPHGWQGQDKRRAGNWNGGSWGPQPGARAPSAVPLNKAAMGPKMPGYYNDASQMGMGPTGRNDGVLYGRNEQSNWSVQGQMGMHGGPRMQGMPSLRPPSIGDGLVEGLEGLQVGGDGGMMRGQRKPSNGERQEETDDDMFAMFRFKVVPCSKQFVHDWKECSFAHEGETARRRHPSLHTATPCPDFKSTKSCPRGDSCTMAHGPWEAGLHPDAFKTNLCAYGKGCQRRMCFFAHDGCELRSPQPGASQQLMQQPVMQMGGGQGPSSWQSQASQQQVQMGGNRHQPFNNFAGAAQRGGSGHQRGRSSGHVTRNGVCPVVPGQQVPNVGLGFEDMSMPADRKAQAQSGGITASKAWAPGAQVPGAGSNPAVRGITSTAASNTVPVPNVGPANSLGPGGKPVNHRRGNPNLRGVASFNATRMSAASDGEIPGDDDVGLKPMPDAEDIGTSGGNGKMDLQAAQVQSPEWAHSDSPVEETSWVDKLLDSTLDFE